MKPIPKNISFIIGGIILMLIAEFMLHGEIYEIIKLVIAFVGFAALLNGVFGFYELYKSHKDEE